MKLIRPLVYVSCPYTDKDPEVIKYRLMMFAKFAESIENGGKEHATSALFNQMLLDRGIKLDASYSYWQSYSRSMIHKSDRLVVLCLQGWDRSVGVSDEVEYAKFLNLSVEYVTFPHGY